MYQSYSPADVQVSFNGLPIVGLAADSFIRLSRDTDIVTKTKGNKGELALTHTGDRCGSIELELMQTSPSNLTLSTALQLQEKTRVPTVGVLMIQDPSGSVMAICKNAFFTAYPEVELGEEQNTKVWMMGCEVLEFTATPPGFVPITF